MLQAEQHASASNHEPSLLEIEAFEPTGRELGEPRSKRLCVLSVLYRQIYSDRHEQPQSESTYFACPGREQLLTSWHRQQQAQQWETHPIERHHLMVRLQSAFQDVVTSLMQTRNCTSFDITSVFICSLFLVRDKSSGACDSRT
jgi:hypothetical protein